MAGRAICNYVPHRRTQEELAHAPHPLRASDLLPRGNPVARFNAALTVKVTNGVGTMWCAYAFAALTLVSLPAAISSHKRGRARVLDITDLPAIGPSVCDHRGAERDRGGGGQKSRVHV